MTFRIRTLRLAGLLLAAVAIAAFVGDRLPGSTPSVASTSTPSAVPLMAEPPGRAAPRPRRRPPGPLGVADGAVPDGTTVFDGGVPGVARLDPALLGALRRAATDARADGVTFGVDSGWRSAAYQQHLLDQAVAQYGSEAAAARWVARPEVSEHVSGDAVDLGGAGARDWLAARGAAYGLCRVYANEPWHFELRPDAATSGCPATYADPTRDPRMQK